MAALLRDNAALEKRDFAVASDPYPESERLAREAGEKRITGLAAANALAPGDARRYRWKVVSLFVTLVTLAVIAIPIVFVVKIVRRLKQVSEGFTDPARLQRVFAESAAAALRRAGADPNVIAKVEKAGRQLAGRAVEQHAAAYEARIGLQRKGGHAAQSQPPAAAVAEPISVFEMEPRRAPHPPHRRPRPRHHPPVAPLGGIDAGDRFRLAEPPDLSEPHGPVGLSANWLALAALVGAAAYYFVR